MTVAAEPARPGTVSLIRLLPRLARDPVNMLADLGRRSGGGIVRLRSGRVPVYLVSHPDDVQHVLRGRWENYVREGMFWRPLRRLLGHSVLDDGSAWRSSRDILQPLFTARYVASLAERTADVVDLRVGELEEHARSGRAFDAGEEMADVVNETVVKVLFGGRLSREHGRRLSSAYDHAARSIAFRLLLPSMPYSARLPGDRPFMAAVQTIDDVMLPMVRRALTMPDDGADVLSALLRARRAELPADGRPARPAEVEAQLRDDAVSVYGAAAESTATTLTWLWTLLDAHPHVASRLYAEVEHVVGSGPVLAEHVRELTYTRMVLDEVMRLRPSGWLFPRMAVREDTVGGVRVEAGAQMLITPYATHRLDEFWDRPLEFDPERFAPGEQERRHRYAYFPFGGGPHQCLGKHLFLMSAPLIVAAILSRFRPLLRGDGRYTPAPAGSLRPREKVELVLVPAARARQAAR
ncbi:cytochrome P450 [Sphaerisporangium sp. TRM90804]|uniref:cytochrome P450 n=1 Tax=Sphaerisporangium sp. TRM90804 TaxID=3031113 RepID=UPI0024495EB9|nr:cytochrome P450 [Sphaerisporangium sp. TRM90804]MDH2424671.1 cytochrome P450 [Sphaerisporangium sp. TRM90804]